MSKLKDLKAAIDLEGVAHLLNFKPSAVSYILYKKGMSSNYKTFDIKKRNGGLRHISAPTPDLKLLQRRLAKVLQDAADDIRVSNKFGDNLAHGFRRNRSIITNAKAHRRHRFVFNIDLADSLAPSILVGCEDSLSRISILSEPQGCNGTGSDRML